MASAIRPVLFRLCCRHTQSSLRHFSTRNNNVKQLFRPVIMLSVSAATGFAAWKIWQHKNKILPVVNAKVVEQADQQDEKPTRPHTYREVRFIQFASVEYKGISYMTPQDFLESMTEEMPRPRIGRRKLSQKEVEEWLKKTPGRSRGSNKLFRNLHSNGLISYTEYLFLLCVLTKPQSGFRIAFNMFDTDGNQIVDKKEFLVLESFFTLPPKERKFVPRQQKKLQALLDLEQVFSKEHAQQGDVDVSNNKGGAVVKEISLIADGEDGLCFECGWKLEYPEKNHHQPVARNSQPSSVGTEQRDKSHIEMSCVNLWRKTGVPREIPLSLVRLASVAPGLSVEPIQDTTLLIHFFGSRGTDVLKYGDFHRFMENLQSEVIELEFMEFSKGMATISEEDFARILLRYTMLDKYDVYNCISRVKERIPVVQGITFNEFKQFCQFLNNLDDFAIAMKMYTFADQAVSKDDFQRAVYVCTGYQLSPHLVNTVFQIFDSDGDGHLSHKEFISIMKDRLHRGSRSHLMHTQDTWNTFKSCVKNEMKSY